jgi:hypothetical protein
MKTTGRSFTLEDDSPLEDEVPNIDDIATSQPHQDDEDEDA